mgnify:CR=1 FL=1
MHRPDNSNLQFATSSLQIWSFGLVCPSPPHPLLLHFVELTAITVRTLSQYPVMIPVENDLSSGSSSETDVFLSESLQRCCKNGAGSRVWLQEDKAEQEEEETCEIDCEIIAKSMWTRCEVVMKSLRNRYEKKSPRSAREKCEFNVKLMWNCFENSVKVMWNWC